MTGFTIQFNPWPPFHAAKDPSGIHAWLDAIGVASVQAFKGGMGGYPPASAPGAWPNSRSGALLGSIDHKVEGETLTVGTNTPAGGGGAPYGLYLRYGTIRMARRKMSDNALQEGMKAAGSSSMGHWVKWVQG